ncbi:MAG: ATP-binding protein [Actinomycetota bacterium]
MGIKIKQLGGGLGQFIQKLQSRSRGATKLLPVLIASGLLFTSFGLWHIGNIYERAQIRRKVRLATDSARNEGKAALNYRLVALEQLITPWEQMRQASQADWQMAADTYSSFFPSCQLMQWIDPSFKIRRTIAISGSQFQVPTGELHRQLLATQSSLQQDITIIPHQSPTKKWELWVYIRRLNQGRFDGFFFATFRADILFQTIFHSQILPEYGLTLSVGQQEFFTRHSAELENQAAWSQESSLSLDQFNLQVRAWPSSKLLAEEDSVVPELVLAAGVLVSFSLGWAVYSAQQTQVRKKEVEAINNALNQEIRDRIAAELAQRQHIEVIDLATDAIAIRSLDGTILYWNSGAEKLYGWSKAEVTGQALHTLLKTSFPQPEAEILAFCLQQGYWEGELIHSKRDGTNITVAGRWTLQRNQKGEPSAILEINNDITTQKVAQEALRQSEAQLREQATDLEAALLELQRTQAQLIQSEKLSSLGQLVAGVAHEINNPVNFIYGNLIHTKEYVKNILDLLELYQQEYPQPADIISDEIEAIDLDFLKEDLPKILDSMRIGADRIRDIVLSLRNFSRLDEAEMKEVNIHDGIDSTLMILQSRLKAKPGIPSIKIIKEYGDISQVQCYPGQLNQVFMNLLSNAIDALEAEQENKKFNESLPPPTISIRTELIDNNCVQIRIADNGPGIPKEVGKRLFDPFFTTKPIGKGTGLGLAISHSIVVEKHGGKLLHNSAIGQGAEFIIEIPLNQ